MINSVCISGLGGLVLLLLETCLLEMIVLKRKKASALYRLLDHCFDLKENELKTQDCHPTSRPFEKANDTLALVQTTSERFPLGLKSHYIVITRTALRNEASVATLQQFGQSWGLHEPGSRQKSLKSPTLISHYHTVQLN